MRIAPNLPKIGDILKFSFTENNIIVYGYYLSHSFVDNQTGDGHGEQSYIKYKIQTFDRNYAEYFYEWELSENLTKEDNK